MQTTNQKQFLTYVEELMSKDKAKAQRGPVITVSREYGCPGIPVAESLVLALTENFDHKWTVVEKEILIQAAEKMEMSPSLVEKLASQKPPGIFGQIIGSFSGVYVPRDIRAKRTIAQIIGALANEGRCVILGRGGAVLTRDIQQSLHIHLHAQISWRKERIKRMDKITSDEEAVRKIAMVDRERIFLRDFYAGEETGPNLFDLSFNCEYFSVDEIVEIILNAARVRKLQG